MDCFPIVVELAFIIFYLKNMYAFETDDKISDVPATYGVAGALRKRRYYHLYSSTLPSYSLAFFSYYILQRLKSLDEPH